MKLSNKILLGLAVIGIGAAGASYVVIAPKIAPEETKATDSSYTVNFVAGNLETGGGTFESSGVTWTYGAMTYYGYDTTKGAQIGSGNNPQTAGWDISTSVSNFGSGITGITANASTAKSGTGKLTINAGGVAVLDAQALTTTPTAYSASISSAVTSGTVSFHLAATAKAMYFKTFTITYIPLSLSYDPVVSVNLSSSSGTYNVTGGETVTASVLPSTADPHVSWTSSDEFVATVSGGTIYAAGAGTATVTATSVGMNGSGSAVAATFAVTVNAFGIADLRGSDNLIATAYNGKIVAVTGTLTYKASFGVYVQSGDRAIYGYGITPSSLTVGHTVTVKGTLSSYHGLLELSDTTAKDSGSVGEAIVTSTIANFDATSLLGQDCRTVTISLKWTSGTVSAAASTVNCLFGTTAVVMRCSANDLLAADVTSINLLLSKVGTYGTFVFEGPLGWYSSAPQLALVSGSAFSSSDITAVDALVTKLSMSTTTADQCQTLFPEAKSSYEALSADQKNMFDNASGYTTAHARYVAWSVAYVASAGVAVNNINSNSSLMSVSLFAICALGVIAIAGYFLVNKKHA